MARVPRSCNAWIPSQVLPEYVTVLTNMPGSNLGQWVVAVVAVGPCLWFNSALSQLCRGLVQV